MNQFEDMQTFIRIVEAGSITKAADQIDTVKSAVSRRLSDLEKRLGVTLLTRTTRSQTLTESGKSYYQQCLRIVEDVAEVESGLRNDNCALVGKIKIAAPLSFGLTHLAPALRDFNQQHPDIHYDLDFNDRKVDLVEEGFDLAIRISKLEDSSLIARKMTSGLSVLAASPVYLEQHGTPFTPADLEQGHVKLRYSLAPDNWLFNDKKGNSLSIKIPTVMTASNGDYLLEEAIAGKGLLHTPDFICYQAIQQGKLIPLLTDSLVVKPVDAFAIYPQNRHLSKRVRSLVDFLISYYGDTPYWRI
jgi:DNA-binding transcriptional LysR family regulator